MRIACSRCEAEYDLPEAKLAGGAVRVRCVRCGHTFAVRKRPPPVAPPPPPSAEADFGDFDFGKFDEAPAPAGSARADLRFDELDFGGFGAPAAAPEPPATQPAPVAPTVASAAPSSMELPDLGELDLGDFGDLDQGLDLGDEEPPATRRPLPLDKVRPEELVPPRPRGDVPIQGIAEDIPRLDIQRGPRAQEGVPSPVLPREHRRSPLRWVVLAAAAATAAYTGYNAYRHPEAFTFLSPARLQELWKARQVDALLTVEELQGFYRDGAGGHKAFVIRGVVVNRSGAPQGLIRLRGSAFGADGATLDTKEVYGGNTFTDDELASLPADTLEQRLQNEVGQGLKNVDVAPGARVPFMVVFPSAPAGILKYSAAVTATRSGPAH